ncbi:MAG TPA: type II toxin-antitoxin system Phd/YefM family antitoxin [Thermoanaerobaculia bacterium]|nr:type II toxin-antitoxin system Phd/YefM family antitoxin [Thermoanaerobaculia bacterium]
MRINASKLRQNIYRILDDVIEKGVPVEIERRGKILKIVPPDVSSKLSGLEERDCIRGDPEDLVHMDWLGESRHHPR